MRFYQFGKKVHLWQIALAFSVGMSSGLTAQAVRPQFETAERTADTVAVPLSQAQGEVVPTEAGASNGSGDLGEQWIYQSHEKPKAFTASAEISVYHTTNVALTRRDESDDNYLIGQLVVGWQHALSKTLVFDLNLQQAFFRYDEFTQLNFDSLNAGCGLAWQLPVFGGIQGYARYNFNRLSAENFGSELYTSHSFLVGAQKVFQLSRADSLFLGTSAQLNLADPSDLERREYSLYGGYGVALTRSISADAIYRAAVYDYNQADRTDFNQTLSVALHWSPIRELTVTGSVSGSLNRSDRAVFDYDLLTSGASLSVSYHF